MIHETETMRLKIVVRAATREAFFATYARDFLARDTNLPETEIGDWVLLGNAGSYCASAHTRFLGFPPAEEIFL